MIVFLYSMIGLYAVCVATMACMVLTCRVPDLILAPKYNSMLMDDNY
jgi:hypothetical protein